MFKQTAIHAKKTPPPPHHFHLHHARLELLGRRQGLLQCAEHLHGYVKERCKYHLLPGYRGKERGLRTYEPKSQFRFNGSSFQDFQVVYNIDMSCIFLSKLPKIRCLSVTFLAPRLLWRPAISTPVPRGLSVISRFSNGALTLDFHLHFMECHTPSSSKCHLDLIEATTKLIKFSIGKCISGSSKCSMLHHVAHFTLQIKRIMYHPESIPTPTKSYTQDTLPKLTWHRYGP